MKINLEFELEDIIKIIDYLDSKDIFSKTAHELWHVVEELKVIHEKIDKIEKDIRDIHLVFDGNGMI